ELGRVQGGLDHVLRGHPSPPVRDAAVTALGNPAVLYGRGISRPSLSTWSAASIAAFDLFDEGAAQGKTSRAAMLAALQVEIVPTLGSLRADRALLLQLIVALLQPLADVVPELGEAEQSRRLTQQVLLAQVAALAEQQAHRGLNLLRGDVLDG